MESLPELTQRTFQLQINIVHQTNYVVVVVVAIYLLFITFTYDIYYYTTETNTVSVYNVAAI